MVVGVLSAGVAFVSTNAEACSVCVGWPGEQGVNAGYYGSAILLMALPFVLAVVFGLWVRYTLRRAREGVVEQRADRQVTEVSYGKD